MCCHPLISDLYSLLLDMAGYQPISQDGDADHEPRMSDASQFVPSDLLPVDWAGFGPSSPKTGPQPPEHPRTQSQNDISALTSTLKPGQAGTLYLLVYPDGHGHTEGVYTLSDRQRSPWVACLWFRVKDLAQLMRVGLIWSERNVIWGERNVLDEAGFFRCETRERMPRWACPDAFPGDPQRFYCRQYKLRSFVGAPRWKARFTVWSPCRGEVSRFRLSDLRRENVVVVKARDTNGRNVYNFCKYREDMRYNCIYGDMPLGGWWPWPKPKPAEVGAGVSPEEIFEGPELEAEGAGEEPEDEGADSEEAFCRPESEAEGAEEDPVEEDPVDGGADSGATFHWGEGADSDATLCWDTPVEDGADSEAPLHWDAPLGEGADSDATLCWDAPLGGGAEFNEETLGRAESDGEDDDSQDTAEEWEPEEEVTSESEMEDMGDLGDYGTQETDNWDVLDEEEIHDSAVQADSMEEGTTEETLRQILGRKGRWRMTAGTYAS